MITEKYNKRADVVNSLLCVGLDSAFDLIPEDFKQKEHPQLAFNKYIIEATHFFTAAYKLNIAFYESRGAEGMKELKLTMEYLRTNHPDVVTICDAKRGDTLNTNEQYASEIFGELGFDAVTLNPYMGREPLEPFLRNAEKACIILCRTSNPGAKEIQDLIVDGKPLWHRIAERVVGVWDVNKNCMMVVGATYPEEMKSIRAIAPDMTFLVPGVGDQGGNIEPMMQAGLDNNKKGLIINSSRSIIFSADPVKEAMRLRDEINNFRI